MGILGCAFSSVAKRSKGVERGSKRGSKGGSKRVEKESKEGRDRRLLVSL